MIDESGRAITSAVLVRTSSEVDGSVDLSMLSMHSVYRQESV